jgi:hypothetical protein
MRRGRRSAVGASLAWWVFALASSCIAQADEARHYVGTAYAAADNRVLYREEHFVFDDKGTRTRLVLYRCPSGAPFARKWVRNVGPAEVPDFDLVDARSGYREGVTGPLHAREVYTQANGESSKRWATLPDRADAVIDAGFDAYVYAHWNDLGARHHMAFVVPSRLGYVDLTITGDTADAATRHIRLSLDAWYSFAAPSIDLTYDNADRRLARFEGISNIRTAEGGSQRVRIEFPRSDEQPAPTAAAIQAAAALALTSRCPS